MYHELPTGKNALNLVNMIVEIPKGSHNKDVEVAIEIINKTHLVFKKPTTTKKV